MDLIAILANSSLQNSGALEGEPTKGALLKTIELLQPTSVLILIRQDRLDSIEQIRPQLPANTQLELVTLENIACESLTSLVSALQQHRHTLQRYSHAALLNSGYPQERAALWMLKNQGILMGNMVEPPQDYSIAHSCPYPPLRVAQAPVSFDNESSDDSHIRYPNLAHTAHRAGCIGRSPRWQQTLDEAAALASHPTPILLLGETGSGKEVLARLIHMLSPRAERPMVSVNCAALPDTLAESILFGHEKGSFTGAYKRQKGKFEQAEGGTLFLDELGELSLPNQAKLLRVLETRTVDLLGGTEAVAINVRVIAATNRNLQQEVARGRFREDLYYRLRAGEIEIPSLRERSSDIPTIALHLLERFNATVVKPKQFSKPALKFLEAQPWPGNVRDLMNTIERAALMCPRSVIEPEDFKITGTQQRNECKKGLPPLYIGFSMEDYLHSIRCNLFDKALDQADGNRSLAARLLGVTPQAVHKYLKTNQTLTIDTVAIQPASSLRAAQEV